MKCLDIFRTYVQPRNKPEDPAGFPINHGGFWQPWVTLSEEEKEEGQQQPMEEPQADQQQPKADQQPGPEAAYSGYIRLKQTGNGQPQHTPEITRL